MFEKVFLNIIFIFIVSIQLAHSLKCFTCFGGQSCPYQEIVHCNESSVYKTRAYLETYYGEMYEEYSDDYACFVDRYTTHDQSMVELRGCIQKRTIDCNFYVRVSNLSRESCSVCENDLCNSVAKISSSFGTTIILLITTKMFFV